MDAAQGLPVADLRVRTVAGNHGDGVIGPGGMFDGRLVCVAQSDPCACDLLCEGGGFTVVRDTFESIDIRTDALWLSRGEGCEAAVNIAEESAMSGHSTIYRLFKSTDGDCVVN